MSSQTKTFQISPNTGNDPKPKISFFNISFNGVMKQVASLKPYKACGPEYATEFSHILANIFQDSIDTGTVPMIDGKTQMCAAFSGKGKRSDPIPITTRSR